MPLESLTFEDTEVLIETGIDEVVSETVVESEVLEMSAQGPEGPPGPAGAIAQSMTVGVAAVGGHRVVLLAAGGAAHADTTVLAHAARVVGVTLTAGAPGEQTTVQALGRITEPSWAWTPDADILLGVAGQLTQTPAPGAVFSQRIGYAITPTAIWVELSDPVLFS